MTRRRPTVDALCQGVLAAERGALAQAITLAESTRADDRQHAAALLTRLMPRTGAAARVGITGIPGSGKSTFIDALGSQLTAAGHRVAVLAVDPSSERSGGSILGDKTRMARLCVDPAAFIRPSPAAGTLGGVASRTREAMLLCEAAGFDIILVETVGIGQSETAVAQMTDTFLVLAIAGAGDSLQGIKRGVMELADIVVVNKADGDNVARAQRTVAETRSALRLITAADAVWRPTALSCSALEGSGIDRVWTEVLRHRTTLIDAAQLEARRRAQDLRWMWQLVEEGLMERFRQSPAVTQRIQPLETAVRAQTVAPSEAAHALLAAFTEAPS